MKQAILFIAASMVLSLASCQKDELSGSTDPEDVISFSSYMERTFTRAVVTDVTSTNLTAFKVMAYHQGTSTVYFTTEQTATKQVSGNYTIGTKYYWPITSGLDFFAYSGSGADTISNVGGVACVSYSVPASGTEDFVVAAAEDCTESAAMVIADTKVQALTFNHALTKVNRVILKAKDNGVSNTVNYRYIFTDVSIKGAKTSATYTFNPASGTNWGTATGSADYTFTEYSGNFPGSAADTLEHSAGVNDQFIILPQRAIFSVTYSVQYSPDGANNWTEILESVTKTAEVPMEMGESYDITFHLPNDASPMIFSLSGVEDWTSAAYTGDTADYD